MRRTVTLAAALVLLAVAIVVAPVGATGRPARSAAVPGAAALPDPGTAEIDFVNRINALRASKGLGTLTVDAELTREARTWATTMANAGRIFHTSDLSAGISANWSKLGENVGVGGETPGLFDAFVNSPTHYSNLVDPAFTRVGVGVVISGDRMYTAHRFMAVAAPAPPPPAAAPPPQPAPAPTVPPTTVPPTTTAAPPTVPPTTTTAPPTTVAGPPPKLGPIDRIAGLVDPD